ncbi:hypothetical protein DL768_004295 [Monosporascus sp. mg162]|nr:hypothetical protein DL768_004295 [Monosporascus sp. mg162]
MPLSYLAPPLDGFAVAADDRLDPPVRILDRLRQIAGYTWDESQRPFHSTYDNWHISGTRFVSPNSNVTPTPNSGQTASSPPPYTTRLASVLSSPGDFHSSPLPPSDASSDRSAPSPPATSTSATDLFVEEQHVVARVSYHVLREERAFHIAKNLTITADPDGRHIVRPIDLIRLSPQPSDRGAIVVGIYENPGPNYLFRKLDLGPAFYYADKVDDRFEAKHCNSYNLEPPISVMYFLDFAIGATECLEILHQGNGMVHGEIRADAFHYNVETGRVKLTSFGSGIRSFEQGLTSTGWSSLSKELGAKNKLIYISPEQTGRMPAEPDIRTDIYSLGVVFWMLLTQQPVFTGTTPLDIVQGVLGRRIPLVSNIRTDVPDVLGRIIQKCTAKSVSERYHSASGLRYDLQMVQKFLEDGDKIALRDFDLASRDVSSFFMLPTDMVGRHQELAELSKIIERVARSHATSSTLGVTGRFSDGSTFSTEIADAADISSEGASSAEGNRRSGSFTQTLSSDLRQRSGFQSSLNGTEPQAASNDTVSSRLSAISGTKTARECERQPSLSLDTKSYVDSFSDRQSSRHSGMETSTSLSRQLGSAKYRRRGHCEVVVIEGAGGLGKSLLVQQVLADARRRGYCATAKFDGARRTAFGPLLKLVSSLFKQVWGERDTDTPLHMALKDYVRPVWPMLHNVLGLPEFLFGPPTSSAAKIATSPEASNSGRNVAVILKQPDAPPESLAASLQQRSPQMKPQTSPDLLRSGTSTKTLRLMNIFLDLLRIFSRYHFICFFLDDLHYADDESIELINQVVAARLKMLLILTYRPGDLSPEKVQMLSTVHTEDQPMSNGAKVTRIVLSPLSDDEIIQYVATTLSRPPEEVAPLALVIQSKTGGNPFYIREMLSACHRMKCIWYDYRDSRWLFDLGRLLDLFQGERDFDFLNNEFVTRRLSELPPASRAILAWAAILGNPFSFALVCQLLSGEFGYADVDVNDPDMAYLRMPYSKQEAVAGLQAAVNACVIVQGETDEKFRFAHDRYIQAASTWRIADSRKRMHFIVAETLLKYNGLFTPSKDSVASHICEATNIIRERCHVRQRYRKHLMECAATAVENGARSTASKYYGQALKLLQPDPWTDGQEDVCYGETLKLHIRAAECHVYMGNQAPALNLLNSIFSSAKSAEDKAPAWLLHSRVLAQNGDAEAALTTLKQSLMQLKAQYDPNPTLEKCDETFMRLATKIQTIGRTQLLNPLDNADSQREIIGAILAEAISSAWWSDYLDFYNLALTLINLHLEDGPFPQSGMGFLHFAMIALSRFNMVDFAAELGSQCIDYLDGSRDTFSSARGYMIYANFVSHIQIPIRVALSHSEQAVESAAAAGDRLSVILSFGILAQMRFFASENFADLESICQYSCEEIPGWHQDTRGGTILIAVRQVCRAMQGKTNISSAKEVMSDEQHHCASYKQFLTTKTRNGGRSILIYETLEIVPLYIYGHYEQACEVGRRCLERLDIIWSARNTRMVLLFYGLALSGLTVRKLSDPRYDANNLKREVQETIVQLEGFSQKIKDWQIASDVNYLAWSTWLDAQLAELRGQHGLAVRQYEAALDHAAEHGFLFEEALGNFLMAGFFIRQSARRSATAVLRESVALWRQLGASGVAQRIEEEHALLLHGPTRNSRSAEIGVQTDFAGDAASVTYAADADDVPHSVHQVTAESKASRTAAWRGTMQPEAGAGLPALDMIDLHAILVSSQVISSVLQVDVLLKTMCDVILQTCGASVTQAAIIVQDEDAKNNDEWCIAASGDPERGATAHIPGRPLAGSSQVAENVILYCARFRDSVFLPDLLNDERFGNVSESWLQRNPLSKAVIAIPICHGSKPLLGVLYLEGEPGSFTDRNLTVLQLLVNQIGISYSNALSMKSIEKVSEQNNTMVEVQKRALAQAIEAQEKAKRAEAEANRNVKIAEEAAKAKSIFLANVSHELRTPLNGVIGNSELLRDSNLNKEQLEMAESIRVSADLLLTVINDILDFSKMEADKMKLYIIAFNPEEMVREVVRAVSYSNREKASKKNVKIIQDINLPPMLIYGDPIRLHQVLGNLIGNSLKFTEDGSITIGARIDADSPEKATLTFWVKDTGIGIPPKQLAKLFRPFSQADASTARKYGGSGLGLSICKSLIETMMKGRIELESEENVGTTAWFTVTFDKAKPEVSAGDAQMSAIPQAPDKSREPPRHNSLNLCLDLTDIPKDQLRICIAEDNLINQRIAINYMRKLGYTNVDAYENGMKAVEGLRQKAKEGQPYHIVLMDVQMPVLDGYEATKLLRKDEIDEVRKVLVIAMTASAIQGDRERCLAAGMNDYLAKPVKADLLKKKLDTYTTGHVLKQNSLLKDSPEPDHSGRKSANAPPPKLSPVPSPPTIRETMDELDAANKSPPLVIPIRDDLSSQASVGSPNEVDSPHRQSIAASAQATSSAQPQEQQQQHSSNVLMESHNGRNAGPATSATTSPPTDKPEVVPAEANSWASASSQSQSLLAGGHLGHGNSKVQSVSVPLRSENERSGNPKNT